MRATNTVGQAELQAPPPRFTGVVPPPLCRVEEPVIGHADMRLSTRPTPLPWLCCQTAAGGILFYVDHRGPQVRLVERDRVIAGLPEMSHAAQTKMESASIVTVKLPEGLGKRLRMVRCCNQVDMVGHEAPSQHGDPVVLWMMAQK